MQWCSESFVWDIVLCGAGTIRCCSLAKCSGREDRPGGGCSDRQVLFSWPLCKVNVRLALNMMPAATGSQCRDKNSGDVSFLAFVDFKLCICPISCIQILIHTLSHSQNVNKYSVRENHILTFFTPYCILSCCCTVLHLTQGWFCYLSYSSGQNNKKHQSV